MKPLTFNQYSYHSKSISLTVDLRGEVKVKLLKLCLRILIVFYMSDK